MPHANNSDLPASVRAPLPAHAQDIFREAFSHAFVQHGGDEPAAFRIAWGAVKRGYEKVGSEWEPKPERP
jgi:cation transport regulator